ncbi:PQQ-dependent sugar dehydrogenase [Marinobacter sp. GN3S48]|uniref:PQQ-dependent sugar dehydrogenase n=1 Tax=Marinobacter sp. GN3S48 TaxID=3382302 RepID=UPI00387A8BA2
MEKRVGWFRVLGAFLIALIMGVLAGSLVQTQFNLLALRNLGVEIGLGTRLQTSLEDLVNFAPVYAVVFGASFLVSQLVASLMIRQLELRGRAPFLSLGAAVGLWVTFKLVDFLAPMPTLIAATRGAGGMVAMLATAAVAGWLFAHFSRRRRGLPRHLAIGAVIITLGWMAPQESALADASSGYRLETFASGLEHPWSLAFLPDGRALVTERPGRLRLLSADGQQVSEPLAGVPKVFASGQAGLFDVLVAPDFEQSRHIYLAYACGTWSANHTCVARGRLVPNGLDDVREVFRSLPAKTGDAHYGGRMAWLPDATLILTLGDGFDYREEAQKLTSHIGTIIRINRDGSAPEDNPFIAEAEALPEIFSYGHRNVQGAVYDWGNNRLITHEHGPRGGDEINVIEGGTNYGWPVATLGLDYTGARVSPFTEYDGMASPALDWTPSIAPSGMTLYDGDLFPEWQGSLLVGALAARRVHRVVLSNDGAVDMETLFGELNERIRDVRTGPEGAVFLLTDSPEGRVIRVTPW